MDLKRPTLPFHHAKIIRDLNFHPCLLLHLSSSDEWLLYEFDISEN